MNVHPCAPCADALLVAMKSDQHRHLRVAGSIRTFSSISSIDRVMLFCTQDEAAAKVLGFLAREDFGEVVIADVRG